MPEDRRALREALKRQRQRTILVGFDFDCTLTIRHFYKVFAWCVPFRTEAHPHYEAFLDWCEEHELDLGEVQFTTGVGRGVEPDVVLALLDRSVGEDKLHELLREVFFGGAERINAIASWLQQLSRSGAEFAIVTAGISTSVLRVLNAVPEWQPFFPSDRIWDVQQSRHSVQSVSTSKVLLLRDICPKACLKFDPAAFLMSSRAFYWWMTRCRKTLRSNGHATVPRWLCLMACPMRAPGCRRIRCVLSKRNWRSSRNSLGLRTGAAPS
eukprot:s4607_g3.t1